MSCLGLSVKSFKIISGPKVIEDLVKTLYKTVNWGTSDSFRGIS